MNLKQFANVDSLYRDLDNGQEVPWHDYMRRVIDKLGLDNIKPYIPYDIEYLKEKLKEDVHLNNTELQRWDEAGGFWFRNGNPYYTATGLPILFRSNGITCFSPSDGVCVLKEAARMLCEAMQP
jgi:hypothetical protein